MAAYGLPDGTNIGYKQVFNENLRHQNYMANGIVCASMFAVPTGTFSAKCASYDSSNSKSCSPFSTSSSKITLNTCKYSYN